MSRLWTVLISMAAGAAGYLIADVWVRRVLRYLDLEHQIVPDPIFYANAIRSSSTDHRAEERMEERDAAQRRDAVNLEASAPGLPFWWQGAATKPDRGLRAAVRGRFE